MYRKRKLEDAENVLDLPGICGNLRYHSDLLEMVELSIEAGKSIAPHKMEMKVIFYLIEGEVEFKIDGESVELKLSELLEIEPLMERAVFNKTGSVSRLLVIKENNKGGAS